MKTNAHLILTSLLFSTTVGLGRETVLPDCKTVLIEDVPHVEQKPDFCGEACAEMALKKLGHTMDQDDVYNWSGLAPIHGRGCHTAELATALKAIGFKTGPVWYRVDASKAGQEVPGKWKDLHRDLERGVPSIVCMRTGTTKNATEHFRLVLGYDAVKTEVVYHEPAELNGRYKSMKLERFLDLWPLKYESGRWTLIRLRLEPGKIKPYTAPEGFTDADYAQHIQALKKKLPPQGFSFVLQKPFVVIGDEPPDRVRQRAASTVQWATDRLKAQYFKQDPEHITDIWLFKDKASYRKHTDLLFDDQPDTPFGYYSDAHNALVMNIATGGGTLVHEMVHPFVAANFPACPAWLNEGLGSLYEQSSSREGKIVGLTNWRLAGLQQAIRKKRVPSFEALLSTTDHAFYHRDPGTNYAQSRYLCYYLQEKKLLEDFYHAFRADCDADPTGLKTLRRTLGENDLNAFKKTWEAFVLGLRFP